MTGPDRFTFLGVERRITAAADWNRRDWPKLWLYNAHYFDDLLAQSATAREPWHREILRRWIRENPPALGNGWEPYPTSLRIVNWVKWAQGAPETRVNEVRDSLAVQASWLRRRLEFHLLGNHLWVNAKALVFAGTWFEGPEADRWRASGLALFERELAEQILPDGGHVERSPMYQAIVLEDILDLVQLAQRTGSVIAASAVERWRTEALRMLGWLQAMSHPDGEIAQFNDAAFGIAPNVAALTDYARVLGLAVDDTPLPPRVRLGASGYERMQVGDAVLIADVAAIGPDHLTGHAHADTLSFELSVGRRRRLVNSGTSTYEAGTERCRQRGTAAHNTVEVDGQDSSEVWGSFRVARRARVFDVTTDEAPAGLTLAASHDGYRRLRGCVVHHRQSGQGERRAQAAAGGLGEGLLGGEPLGQEALLVDGRGVFTSLRLRQQTLHLGELDQLSFGQPVRQLAAFFLLDLGHP